MTKKILFVSFLALFGQFIFAPSLVPSAQAGWVEFFFPSLRKEGYDPSETLQAPFADLEAQKEKDIKKGTLPENTLPINQAHRDYESISVWATTAVSEAFAFNANSLQKDLESHRLHFSDVGWSEYGSFLKEAGIFSKLRAGRYNLTGVIESPPRLLNEGVIGGTYRWLYQVPVMLSYMDAKAKSYNGFDAENKNMLVNIEIGRSKDVENDQGIWIERWSAEIVTN